jgi:hypothetical protein
MGEKSLLDNGIFFIVIIITPYLGIIAQDFERINNILNGVGYDFNI